MLVRSSCSDRRFEITLADPGKRNAMGEAMFAALHQRLLVAALAADDRLLLHDGSRGGADVVVIRGEGHSFSSGFDLASCIDRPQLLAHFVMELSHAVRALRALPIPVVAEVRGAALAGGGALLAGYPVHRIGVSPAVTVPALMANAGAGPARAITMGGSILDGHAAVHAGLATFCSETPESLNRECDAFVANILQKGPQALRATKRWLNELDGSMEEARFRHTALASAAAAEGDEFAGMLRAFWEKRGK